jgi:hypothetical protein
MTWIVGEESGGSLGASSIVFGLMAMTLVWAPRNEVTTFYFIWLIRLFTGVHDFTIQAFVLIEIGWQAFVAWLFGFHLGSELLHLMGAFFGFGIATVMLKRGWVDCENWDLFAWWKGTHGTRDEFERYRYGGLAPSVATGGGSGSNKSADEIRRAEGLIDGDPIDFEEHARRQEAIQEKALRKMRSLLESGKPQSALAEYRRAKRLMTTWQLGDRDLYALAMGLSKNRLWPDAVPLMEEFIARFPAKATQVRLKLAAVVLEVQRRPRYALKLLADVPRETLTQELERHVRKIERVAEQMIEEGVIELDGQAWA